jgi:Na+/H+ ion antiporter subunit
MPERPRREHVLRRLLAWSIGWVFAGALYLLLIDTTSLPELIVGAGAAVIAATGLELARGQRIVGERIRPRWLAAAYRPVLRVPADVVLVSWVAIRQLFHRRGAHGAFRAAPFRCGDQHELESGRAALAQALGSFAPNTIVVGVDPDRELVLAHQLYRRGGDEAIDVMELG